MQAPICPEAAFIQSRTPRYVDNVHPTLMKTSMYIYTHFMMKLFNEQTTCAPLKHMDLCAHTHTQTRTCTHTNTHPHKHTHTL